MPCPYISQERQVFRYEWRDMEAERIALIIVVFVLAAGVIYFWRKGKK